MKRKVKKTKSKGPSGLVQLLCHPTQETLSNRRDDEAEASTVLCKDCRIASPVESLVSVDALHVQCPLCLYVFFMDGAQRKALSGEGLSRVGAEASGPRPEFRDLHHQASSSSSLLAGEDTADDFLCLAIASSTPLRKLSDSGAE